MTRNLLAAAALLAMAACGAPGGAGQPGGSTSRIEVVAAENFWGSIAAQLAGDRARVTSIISNPNTDPHDYDPTPADARLTARAGLVIVNGAGYDD